MKINFREPSTKRGIVMTITGSLVVYRMLSGHGVDDVDELLARVEWWIGIGITVAGLLGFLPDQPPRTGRERTRATDELPIDLVGQASEVDDVSWSADRDDADHRAEPVRGAAGLHDVVPPERPGESGWNG